MRKEHSLENQAKREIFVGAALGINRVREVRAKKRRTIIWLGHLEFGGTSVKARGQKASHVVDELFYLWKKSREGIKVFPGVGRKSDMPEKDEEVFTESLQSGLLIPFQFDVPIDANHVEWNGKRFPRALTRQRQKGRRN